MKGVLRKMFGRKKEVCPTNELMILHTDEYYNFQCQKDTYFYSDEMDRASISFGRGEETTQTFNKKACRGEIAFKA
jgi:hypothetical protein